MIDDQNLSFGDAFKTAREINGPGGWFIWKGNIYNTYFKEEWQSLSQEERKEYLASIEVQNLDDTNKIEEDAHEENLGLYVDSPSEENGAVIENTNANSTGEYTVDFSTLYKNTEDTQQNLEASQELEQYDQSNEVVLGEIITLDDNSEINENEYFELPDDIEIISISEDESTLLDSTTFDSSEITEFPWDPSSDNQELNQISNDENVISVDFVDDSHDNQTSDDHIPQKEYPWGEAIEKPEETIEETTQQTEKPEEYSSITGDPNEIEETPCQMKSKKLHGEKHLKQSRPISPKTKPKLP